MSLSEIIVDSIMEEVNKLTEDCFLGGSRRFEYSQEPNDWDYFVLITKENYKILKQELRNAGFITTKSEYICEHQWRIGKLDLNVFLDETKFKETKEEHKLIEESLSMPGLITSNLKNIFNLNGTTLYKTLATWAKRHIS